MSPTDDRPFSFSGSSTKLDQRDVAVQAKEASIFSNLQPEVDKLGTSSLSSNKSFEGTKISQRHQQHQDHQQPKHQPPHQKQEHLQQKQERQNKQEKEQNEAKVPKNNSKPQRKESVLSRIFNTSFTMARKGFREKWSQRRNGANEKKESKTNDQQPSMERCFSGRQLNSFESNKTVTTRNKKTFLPQTSNLHSSETTSDDSLLDDIDESWMDEFEDEKSFSKYQMWDFEDKLKGKPNKSEENNCQNNGTDKGQNGFEIILLLTSQYATMIK